MGESIIDTGLHGKVFIGVDIEIQSNLKFAVLRISLTAMLLLPSNCIVPFSHIKLPVPTTFGPAC